MPALSDYVLLEPYDRALQTLRASIEAVGLEIASEWDVSYDLRQDYGVVLAPCRILTVYNSLNLLQNMVMDCAYALSGQVAIAVCDAGGRVQIAVHGHQQELLDRVFAAVRQSGARQLAPVTTPANAA
ncbi:MAG: hypothetical protein IT168_15995 [Bryobacterales bacterium]|nr:hypothetical protein [Bryobacterales bacterium]